MRRAPSAAAGSTGGERRAGGHPQPPARAQKAPCTGWGGKTGGRPGWVTPTRAPPAALGVAPRPPARSPWARSPVRFAPLGMHPAQFTQFVCSSGRAHSPVHPVCCCPGAQDPFTNLPIPPGPAAPCSSTSPGQHPLGFLGTAPTPLPLPWGCQGSASPPAPLHPPACCSTAAKLCPGGGFLGW